MAGINWAYESRWATERSVRSNLTQGANRRRPLARAVQDPFGYRFSP